MDYLNNFSEMICQRRLLLVVFLLSSQLLDLFLCNWQWKGDESESCGALKERPGLVLIDEGQITCFHVIVQQDCRLHLVSQFEHLPEAFPQLLRLDMSLPLLLMLFLPPTLRSCNLLLSCP